MEKRRIQTFGRRLGKMTKGQQRALQMHEGRLLNLQAEVAYDATAIYTLEVGFGMGDALVQQAQQNPQDQFIGVEVYAAGVGACLLKASALGLQNLKVYHEDVFEVIAQLPQGLLSVVQVYFPDPWPKKRHQKRRLLQAEFLEVLAPKLKPEAVLRVATDDLDYAQQLQEFLSTCDQWQQLSGEAQAIHQAARIESKYAQRAQRLGHTIVDIIAQLKPS